jgi:lipopolysaccharide transport system ATP-binding protein
MSEVAIRAENLGKLYRIGEREQYLALRDVLARIVSSPARLFGRKTASSNRDSGELWAVKDISFEIRRGDVVGIVGRNGAGKSTLLKILARVTKPTRGFAEVHGRMGTLLEVGTGFHPELTGRENVFLSGAILGMKKDEIRRRFDEIVAFSEVEKFIDTPLKHYSSGMQMRLAFAVAAHLEPEILLVDEVLAVGDTAFQEKCLGKMQEVSAAGRTVVFVSHQLQAVSALTRKCILLESGRCVRIGETAEIITEYMASAVRNGAVYQAEASLAKPSLVYAAPLTSRRSGIHDCGEPLRFVFRIHTPMLVFKPSFSFQIFNSLGYPVVHLGVLDSEMPLFRQPGTYELTCEIPRSKLYIGRYTVSTHIAGPAGGTHYESVSHICPFEVISTASRELFWRPGTCCYIEEDRWSMRKLAPERAASSGIEAERVCAEIGVYVDSGKTSDSLSESTFANSWLSSTGV